MVTKKEIEIGGKTLSLETGKLALQADGSVMVRYGDSMVLATVVASLEPREDRDYFPLQIEYRERTEEQNRLNFVRWLFEQGKISEE